MLSASSALAECEQVAVPETEVQKNRSTETEVQIHAYGEFAHVLLSEEQHSKLKITLNGHHEDFINQLDRYSQTSPAKFRKYKNHYATILEWYDRAIKKGEIQASPVDREEEARAKFKELYGRSPNA